MKPFTRNLRLVALTVLVALGLSAGTAQAASADNQAPGFPGAVAIVERPAPAYRAGSDRTVVSPVTLGVLDGVGIVERPAPGDVFADGRYTVAPSDAPGGFHVVDATIGAGIGMLAVLLVLALMNGVRRHRPVTHG